MGEWRQVSTHSSLLLALGSGRFESAIIVQQTAGSRDNMKKINLRNFSGLAGNQTR